VSRSSSSNLPAVISGGGIGALAGSAMAKRYGGHWHIGGMDGLSAEGGAILGSLLGALAGYLIARKL
jgi:hypothetical protein